MAPLAVQRILEQLMTSDYWPVYSPFAKEHFGRGKREGKREGKKEGRMWITRAVTAEKTGDLFG